MYATGQIREGKDQRSFLQHLPQELQTPGCLSMVRHSTLTISTRPAAVLVEMLRGSADEYPVATGDLFRVSAYFMD